MARKFELVSGEGSEGNSYVNLSSTGEITLAKALDYEAFKNPVISIRVRCTDDETQSIKNCERVIGFTVEEVFKINVLDELERPPVTPNATSRDLFNGSSFGGPCGSAALPMLLRIYGGQSNRLARFGTGWGNRFTGKLRNDSSFQGKFTPGASMCSHQVNVPAQSYSAGFPGATSLTSFFAAVWDGQLWAPKTGTYKFYLITDDRSALYINDTLVVNDDNNNHAPAPTSKGSIHLKTGLHKFHLRYTQQPPTQIACQLFWAIPGGSFHVIPQEYFYGPVKGQVKKLDSREPNWD